jgi:NADH-quinone oxidoreductase subunit J
MAITRSHPVHALLYFIVSLLATAMVLFTLGAPFVAALEVIVYAGAIMVLFIFVVMMLNLSDVAGARVALRGSPGIWAGPSVLALLLLGELAYMLARSGGPNRAREVVGPERIGVALYGPYLVGLELASFLLLAGLVGAYHVGRRRGARGETLKT